MDYSVAFLILTITVITSCQVLVPNEGDFCEDGEFQQFAKLVSDLMHKMQRHTEQIRAEIMIDVLDIRGELDRVKEELGDVKHQELGVRNTVYEKTQNELQNIKSALNEVKGDITVNTDKVSQNAQDLKIETDMRNSAIEDTKNELGKIESSLNRTERILFKHFENLMHNEENLSNMTDEFESLKSTFLNKTAETEEIRHRQIVINSSLTKVKTSQNNISRRITGNERKLSEFQFTVEDLRLAVTENNFTAWELKNYLSVINASLVDNMIIQSKNSEQILQNNKNINSIEQEVQSQFAESRSSLANLNRTVEDLTRQIKALTKKMTIQEFKSYGDVTTYRDAVFLVPSQRLSWNSAWSYCRRRNSILAHCSDQGLNRYIKSLATKYRSDFWIGGSYDTMYGWSWRTATGRKSLSYTDWVPGEPNTTSRKCMQLWKNRSYRWDNTKCSFSKRFACSKDFS